MRRALRAILFVVIAVNAMAADTGMRPGLWQVRFLKQIADGQDHSAQLANAGEKMQQMMANLPPAQRAQMEAMLKQRGVESLGDGSFKICVSPEMAKNNVPMVDKEGHCRPSTVNHSGAQTTYEFQCSLNGVTTSGTGIVTRNGDSITNHVEMTMQRADGTKHTMLNESQMTFISADCGDVKPADLAPNAAK